MKFNDSVSVESLLALIPAQLIEGAHAHINGINEIHKVTPGDITFVDHPKYYTKALESDAWVVLINQADAPNPLNKTLLFTEDPFSAYNTLVRHFSPFEPFLGLHGNAQIGENTMIMPGAVIGNNVTIGDNCLIYPNVVIYPNSHIGNNVIIHANTVIGSDAFYFKRRPEGYDKMLSCGRVIIEDDVEIGACCTIDIGVSGDTVIGRGTKFDNHIHIGHGAVIGENCLFAAQVGIGGKTEIQNNVSLWGQVGVSKTLTIGEGASVLAQSGVAHSLEGGKTYFGSPALEARTMMRQIGMLKQLTAAWDKVKKLL
jgi:UDP-3-O-[3-hydroxymyristoyl] glucosamine N-acyltransferase